MTKRKVKAKKKVRVIKKQKKTYDWAFYSILALCPVVTIAYIYQNEIKGFVDIFILGNV